MKLTTHLQMHSRRNITASQAGDTTIPSSGGSIIWTSHDCRPMLFRDGRNLALMRWIIISRQDCSSEGGDSPRPLCDFMAWVISRDAALWISSHMYTYVSWWLRDFPGASYGKALSAKWYFVWISSLVRALILPFSSQFPLNLTTKPHNKKL
jgi:hypothetical protein